MAIGKGWSADFCYSPDPDYDTIDIQYDDKDVATIRKDNNDGGKLIIDWLKSEKDYTIPFNWFVELLQEAKNKFSGEKEAKK